MRTWNGVSHPDWCDMDRCAVLVDDAGTRRAVEHQSRPIECNPTGKEEFGLSVYLWQPGGGSDLTAIKLETVDDQCGVAYPMLPLQARALAEALGRALILATPRPGAGPR